MNNIIYSGMITPDGTLLQSLHVHDYQLHTDKNGKKYMLDGGTDYVRCSVNGDELMVTLLTWSPIESVRGYFPRWNNRNKEWILLKDIPDDWLENIISDYIAGIYLMPDKFLLQFIKEKQYRNLNLAE